MRLGRYVLYDRIASGGMAAVHLGRIVGDAGFRRTVAIKRLHPHVAETPGALDMFIDEARLSARVQHRNIVNTLDVVRHEDELFLVMEYVHGAPLASLELQVRKRGARLPLPIVSAIMLDVLAGLGAIHAAVDESGAPLAIVHRDVSPQNVLVGVDGTARVLDFGIATAAVRIHTTRDDRLKGKLHYMAPEQFLDDEVDGRTDQFAAGVVLWGLLTGRRLFDASNEAAIVARVLESPIAPPSREVPEVPEALDAVVLRALSRKKEDRFASVLDFATALRSVQPPGSTNEVREWVEAELADALEARTALLARVESGAARELAEVIDPPSEQTATVTIATLLDPRPAQEGAGRRRLLYGLAGVATAIGVATVAISASRAAGPSQVPSAALSSSAPPPVIPPPSETAATAAVPSLVPPLASLAVPVTSAARPAVRVPPRPRQDPRKAACAQLFTTDANGIQRVKPECL